MTVARWHGGAVRVHVSILVIVLLSGLGPVEVGVDLSLLALIILHELGHVAAIKLCGGQVTGIELAPFGGMTSYADTLSPAKKTVVAWGGAVMQLLVFIAALVMKPHFGPLAEHPYLDGLAISWILINPMLLIVNLLPIEPLDGSLAWKGLRRTANRVGVDVNAEKLGLTRPPRTDEVLRGDAVPEELQKAIDAAVSASSGSKTPAFPITPRDGSMRN